jgi:hypothetical protein
MTHRLIDEQRLESTDEHLATLFRAARAFETDPFRKRRVLVSLTRSQGRLARRFWVQPAILAALLVSGTATATFGQRYAMRATGFLGFGARAEPASKSALRRAESPAGAATAADALPVSTNTEAVVDTAAESQSPSPGHAKAGTRTRYDASEDATRVVEAIQALRAERDPSRAQELLNEYLKTQPHGALSEDALALAIEAASVQHDPRATEYARRYLAKSPNGKYRDLAKRALAAH